IVQLGSAGMDHVPVERFPDGVLVLSNAGVYAEPMAEHALALYLALSKRLLIEHRKLEAGEFDQFRPNRRVAGSTCGIFGFGAAGEATARLLKALGVRVLAINRSGESEEDVDFLGTPDDLEYVLERCDGLIVSAALTPETRGMIDREHLQLLPDDGMLINIARGEIVVQQDLYEHLVANREFQAGIESWWTEPVRHGEFALEYPLLDLPNVLGCPHNASQVPDIHQHSLARAARNVADALGDGNPENVVKEQRGY
ncbi:MAG: NAD(P)-dependent oxidoreductase, partial [Halobacteriales archaeon]|nr:NAD(P)-dependent oxidoreductase [Halobacteriales archaeon]